MNAILSMPLRDLAARIARREITSESVIRACIERIEVSESWVQAWRYYDPALALRQAHLRDTEPILGPLHGIPIGVKDLMDTADMPTSYGSPIYAGHRPVMDAACVAASRSAGAIIMGKTVTTEFATFQPGPTRNPHSPDTPRTPGGSSSGSAAAVAAGMVPIAFGTQTAGSVIRPAAYCGLVGYKPSHGTLPLAGVKSLAPSLDTVGVLARTVDDVGFFVGALARLPLALSPSAPDRLRVGICHTPYWEHVSPDAREALGDAARRLQTAGATLSEFTSPALDGLAEAQIEIMGYEAAAAFAPELATRPDELSAGFGALLAAGGAIKGPRYFAAQALAAAARVALGEVFDKLNILMAPSAPGEAPSGLTSTGDPILNRLWTLLGNPCVTVPAGTSKSGMPLGVTLIGPRYGDAQTLAAAMALERLHA